MNKICTSIEQSQKLIELGIDVNIADMCWQKIYDENHLLSDYRIELIPFRLYSGLSVPAWSLATLLSIIPKSLIYTPSPFLNGYCCKNIEHDIETYGDDAVDAAFEMICWLKENGKI